MTIRGYPGKLEAKKYQGTSEYRTPHTRTLTNHDGNPRLNHTHKTEARSYHDHMGTQNRGHRFPGMRGYK